MPSVPMAAAVIEMAGYPLNLDSALLPSVNPSGAPGGDYEHIDVSPDMFGGRIARSLEGLGQGVEKVSNTAFDVATQQKENDERTHAAELHTWASKQINQENADF